MVLIHYKKTDLNQFLYETPASIPIEQLVMELVEINNMRILLDQLCVCIEDLATYGPLKPEETRGLTSQDLIDAAMETMPKEKKPWAVRQEVQPGQRINEDKNGYRLGVIQSEQITKMMIDNVTEVKKSISKNLVDQKVCLTVKGLHGLFDQLRGVMMIAYPAFHGLPEWEPAREILEQKYDITQSGSDQYDYLDPKVTSIWWAGKEFIAGKQLKDYTGKNEKTKIIVRMQKSGSGMPVREPAVDEETQKRMIAYYHKKQQEQKELEDNNDDNYLNSAWANPQNLKNQLVGGPSNISWKPK